MTLQESINATMAQSSVYSVIGNFTKAFRTDELSNIEAGESFVIPENYTIFSQRMMRNGQPVKDRDGNVVTAEFIKVETSKGRIANFYPSSLTKLAFRVDENGKDVEGSDRIVRTEGNLVGYVKGKKIDDVMQALKGCTIECTKLNPVNVRAFGVSNEEATAKDVQKNNIGTWNLIGDKKPAGWTA